MAGTEPHAERERHETLSSLCDLIAVDRRMPRLERVGEARMAHEAAEPGHRAIGLIDRIEAEAKAGG